MILRLDDPNSAGDYLIARYLQEGSTLKVCILDPNRVREAIKQRKLNGSLLGDSMWGGALITESSKGVLKFLKSTDSEAMFICPAEFNFKRVTN